MAVCAPAIGAQIHFHVPGTRRVVANLQNRPTKIRAAFQAGKAGMKYPDTFSTGGLQFTSPQPLVLPDGLDQPLGGELFVAQKVLRAEARAPLGINIFRGRNQATLLLEFWPDKVNSKHAVQKKKKRTQPIRNLPVK